jgi:hypothetical protein
MPSPILVEGAPKAAPVLHTVAPQQPAKREQDVKVAQAAVPTLEDLAKDLETEITLTQEVVKQAEKRWTFRTIDVSKEKTLIATLATKLANILKQLFDKIISTTKLRPMTSAEELELAKVAKRLEKAYTAAAFEDKTASAILVSTGDLKEKAVIVALKGDLKEKGTIADLKKTLNEKEAVAILNKDDKAKLAIAALKGVLREKEGILALKEKAASAAMEAAHAKSRAKAKDEKTEALAELSKKIDEFQKWLPVPKCNARNYPVVNWFVWTQKSAQTHLAQMQIQKTEALIRDVLPYPALLKPRMEELVKAKQDLLALAQPGSREYLATKREIGEHAEEIKKLEKVLSVR